MLLSATGRLREELAQRRCAAGGGACRCRRTGVYFAGTCAGNRADYRAARAHRVRPKRGRYEPRILRASQYCQPFGPNDLVAANPQSGSASCAANEGGAGYWPPSYDCVKAGTANALATNAAAAAVSFVDIVASPSRRVDGETGSARLKFPIRLTRA
jgi:hypothetical protein